MRHRLCLILLFTLAAIGLAGTSDARPWPRPAGGVSASGDPEVVFTFDDGPHEKHTAAIMDALDAHGVKAIFFWTGQRVLSKTTGQEERKALVGRAVRDGHLVGNHTISHAKLCVVSKKDAAAEIDDNAALFAELSGLPLTLMRVPYGARCKRLEKMLEDRGLAHMHWDIDPQEFRSHDAAHAFGYVTNRLKRLKDGERAILLMHDTQPTTAKAIPRILEWIASENERRSDKGLRPLRIISGSELVAEQQPAPLFSWTQESLSEGANALVAATSKLFRR